MQNVELDPTVDESTVEKFKRKAAEFVDAGRIFFGIDAKTVPEDMRPEYDRIKSRYNLVGKTVSAITSAIDKTSNFFSNLFGTDLSGPIKNAINQRYEELGALPVLLLGGAAVIGAIAAMTAVIGDIYKFKRTYDERLRLEGKGLSPQEAASITPHQSGFGAELGKGLVPILLIGGGFLAYKFFIQGKS